MIATEPKDLQEKVQSYLSPEKRAVVEEAYRFAAKAHDGQRRLSGEPYIEHPVQAALYLANLRLDASTLAAALLHDVMEDCNVSYQELSKRFGPEVAKLVDGVTKLTKIEAHSQDHGLVSRSQQKEHDQAINLRKMLVAMAEDIRVVLIKLADRLHNMRTLKAHPPEKRVAIAQETLDIYAPLAHRLGFADIKWRLEDLSFRYLKPKEYRELSHLIATNRAERENYIQEVSQLLKKELARSGIKAQITGRPKHIYSLYQKMQRYAEQGKELGQIYDLFALRVVVDEIQDCYSALGVIHGLWRPVSGQFDDYIANPKENMYQSLHTTVICQNGTPLEIQIRTHEMHRLAEYGVAAHWRYKESGSVDLPFEEKMTWLRHLLEWQQETGGAEEFLENVRTDVFQDQVFVYTPKGEIKELPSECTPLDFAYRIHTELGQRCIGAKVNGKLVPLNYRLKNGDTVEILTSKIDRGPSLDWLNPHLGYVHTANAREKIRLWFRRQERGQNIARGRELLQKELKHLGIPASEEETAKALKYETVDDFLAALGVGTLTVQQVAARLGAQQQVTREEVKVKPPPVGPASGIEVLGVGDLLTRMAGCCSPLPGDEIVGFITRNRGVTVHLRSCINVLNEDEKERLVPVTWGPTQHFYPVRIGIEAWDRVGLLRDVTTLVSAERINIASVVTGEHEDGSCSLFLTVYTKGIEQLSRLLSKLEGVNGVNSVSRSPSRDIQIANTQSQN